MTSYLLDANVLIALAVTEHEHHDVAAHWARNVASMALCPITEGALVRFTVRLGGTPGTAARLLRGYYADPRIAFWPDTISYLDAPLEHVRGHRQVTDAYLVGLARSHDALLATFDQALAESHDSGVHLIDPSSFT